MYTPRLVDISGLDKAEVLLALYHASKPIGWGMVKAQGFPKTMTLEEARRYIENPDLQDNLHSTQGRLYFDYLRGRPIKCYLGDDEIDVTYFDRYHGTEERAKRAIRLLRESKERELDAIEDYILKHGEFPSGIVLD